MYTMEMNDLNYDFVLEPFEVIRPDPNYKVDEAELQKSIERAREIGAEAREYLRKLDEKQPA